MVATVPGERRFRPSNSLRAVEPVAHGVAVQAQRQRRSADVQFGVEIGHHGGAQAWLLLQRGERADQSLAQRPRRPRAQQRDARLEPLVGLHGRCARAWPT